MKPNFNLIAVAVAVMCISACERQKSAADAVAPKETPAAAPAPAAKPLALTPENLKATLPGRWRHTEDWINILVIDATGAWADTYEGHADQTSNFTWRAVPGSALPAEAKPYNLPTDGLYVELKSQHLPLFFRVTSLSADRLELRYLGKDDAMVFDRLK